MKWESPKPPVSASRHLLNTAGAGVAAIVFWPAILALATIHRRALARALSVVAVLTLAGCATGPGLGNPENMTASVCTPDAALMGPLTDAVASWKLASGGRVDMGIAEGDTCELVVRLGEPMGDAGEFACGRTEVDGSLITVRDPRTVGCHMANALVHEIGHFLTGPDHSPNREDVMWAHTSTVLTPTAADVARLPQ